MKSCGFSYAVLSKKTKDDTRRWGGESKKLKGVGTETVAAFLFQLVCQIDNGDGFKGTFSDAYSTANTEVLHDLRLLVIEHDGFNLVSNWWTETIAWSTATFGFASLLI